MLEEIDTNSNFSNEGIPDGRYTFRILDIRTNGLLRIFGLSYDGGKEADQIFFDNQLGALLKCLGCKETSKGKYILDSDKTIGDVFKATVYHEPDKKDKTKIYQRMKDFEQEVPFA